MSFDIYMCTPVKMYHRQDTTHRQLLQVSSFVTTPDPSSYPQTATNPLSVPIDQLAFSRFSSRFFYKDNQPFFSLLSLRIIILRCVILRACVYQQFIPSCS